MDDVYTASDVREELRARAVLQCSEELDLVHNLDNEGLSYSNQCDEDKFLLHLDGFPKRNTCAKTNNDTSNKTTGMRQRKKGSSETQPSQEPKWSQVNFADVEEEKLRNVNPMELFGALPPHDLKIAQKQAKESLKSYVEAANFAIEIIRITSSSSANKK